MSAIQIESLECRTLLSTSELLAEWGTRAEAVAVQGDIVYLNQGQDFVALDFSDPSAPVEVSRTTLPGLYQVNAITLAGHAYLAHGLNGVHIVDISDPASPQVLGTRDTYSAHDVAVVGHYAYVADGLNGLKIINAADPSAPVVAGGALLPDGSHAQSISLYNSHAYITNGTSLHVFDVSDPSTPIHAGKVDLGPTRDVQVLGNYAYVADSMAGLRIVNIANPAAPVQVSTVDGIGLAYSVTMDESLAYIASSSGIHVVDVSKPTAPFRVGGYTTPGHAYAIAVGDEIAYSVGEFGLVAVDLALPPANDDLDHALVITDTPTPTTPVQTDVQIAGATAESWETIPPYIGSNSVWFRWTPASAGKYAISIPESWASIQLFTPATGYPAISSCFESGLNELAFTASSREYIIRIDTSDPAFIAGKLTLSVADAPANDDFANRAVIPYASETEINGNLRLATCESGENWFPSWQPASLWYEWIAPHDTLVRFDFTTAGSIQRELYLSSADSPGLADLSAVSKPEQAMQVTAGTRVYVRIVQNFHDPLQTFALTVRDMSTPSNDRFANRQPLVLDVPVDGTTIDSWFEPEEPELHRWADAHSVWYEFTATDDRFVSADTGWMANRYIGIYEHLGSGEASVSDLSLVAHGSRNAGWYPEQGKTYYIQVLADAQEGWSDFTIEIATQTPAPLNDRLANAQVINATAAKLMGRVTWATLEAAEPFEFTGPDQQLRYAERTVWYQWTCDTDALMRVRVESGLLFALGVYSDALAEIGSHMPNPKATTAGQLQDPAIVEFTATKGKTYYFAVAIASGQMGQFTLEIEPIELYPPVPWTISGTSGGDQIALTRSGPDYQLTLNGEVHTRPATQVESITLDSGDGNDTISIGPDVIVAAIYAGAGDDSVNGSAGPDLIYGGDGNDTIAGNDGMDTIYGNFGHDVIMGGLKRDSILGGLDDDTITAGDGPDSIYGGNGRDLLRGGIGADFIEGRGKADTLYGGAGNDTLYGHAGDDLLYGDDGDDTLYARDGEPPVFHDTISGGSGTDEAEWDSLDTVLDYEVELLA